MNKKTTASKNNSNFTPAASNKKKSGNSGQSSLLLQRQPNSQISGIPFLPSPFGKEIVFPEKTYSITPSESTGSDNQKLIELAQAYTSLVAANPDAYVEVSAYLDSALQYDTKKLEQQRETLTTNMSTVKESLKTLGIPKGRVEVDRPTVYSTNGGNISIKLYKKHASYNFPPELLTTPPETAKKTLTPEKKEEEASSLPDIGLSKLTDHELDIYIGKFKISIPKSMELQFKSIPISNPMNLQISIKGEISDLAGLVSPPEPKPEDPAKLGPPITVSMSVTLNGIPDITIKASAAMNLQNNTVTTGITFTLIGDKCVFTAPRSAIEKINTVQKEFSKYNSGAQETAPEDDVGRAAHIIENIDKLYQAIKEIEDAKGKCQKGPTLEVGPTVTFPFGDYPEGMPPDPARRPVWGGGLTVKW